MQDAEYRDSSGKTLDEYPQPSVAVDTVALTYDKNRGLEVLVVRRPDGGFALPGTFLHPGEVLADAVQRALNQKAGVEGLEPRQLQVFDRIGRDSRGWVLSVAHVCVIPVDRLAGRFPDRTALLPVEDPGDLIYDHCQMIGLALADLRTRYADKPDPDHLLGDTFTLRQLRLLHEAVAGAPIGPAKLDTFRRHMRKHLEPTTEFDDGDGRGRPAELFRREAAADHSLETPPRG